MDRRRQQLGACSDSMSKSSYSQLMEKELREVVNMTQDMEEEIKINVRWLFVSRSFEGIPKIEYYS